MAGAVWSGGWGAGYECSCGHQELLYLTRLLLEHVHIDGRACAAAVHVQCMCSACAAAAPHNSMSNRQFPDPLPHLCPPRSLQRSRVERMASKIRQRVHINGHILVTRLVGELAALGEEESLVMRALVHMNQLGELQYRSERKVVHRVR